MAGTLVERFGFPTISGQRCRSIAFDSEDRLKERSFLEISWPSGTIEPQPPVGLAASKLGTNAGRT